MSRQWEVDTTEVLQAALPGGITVALGIYLNTGHEIVGLVNETAAGATTKVHIYAKKLVFA